MNTVRDLPLKILGKLTFDNLAACAWHAGFSGRSRDHTMLTALNYRAVRPGHEMPSHYSHVRLQAKRTALDALSMTRPLDKRASEEGADTKRKNAETTSPEVV